MAEVTKKELLAEIASLQEQLATAKAGAGQADAGDVDGLKAQLIEAAEEAAGLRDQVVDLNARLTEESGQRSQLAAALAAAETEIRNLHVAGVATPPKPAAPVTTGPSITVRTKPGRQLTRYRAGLGFTSEAVTIPLADLSEDDLKALKGDPELVVTD